MKMTSLSRATAAILLAVASSAASAAPTVYAFDSVSRIDLDTKHPSITGILRNTTTPITVSFADNTNGDFRFAVSRCVPVFLNMMDKAGRYYLNLTIDPAVIDVGLISCGLELRS
jgi:TRAP-type mannitol/chloroaromatic compound transport system substrate-binding protein